jgi:hypothetical protein
VLPSAPEFAWFRNAAVCASATVRMRDDRNRLRYAPLLAKSRTTLTKLGVTDRIEKFSATSRPQPDLPAKRPVVREESLWTR